MEYRLFKKMAFVKKNLKQVIELAINNVLSIKDENYVKFEIKNVGRLLLGEAYYHEVDQYYSCIGLEVELETQFDFQDKPHTEVGFYSVWIGKCHKCAPVTFEVGYQALGKADYFTNGCGDHVEVMKELASIDEVNKIISDNKISLSEPSN